MKVLILSVTAGFGHHATANAIENMLRERGVAVNTVDVYKTVNRFLYDAIDKGYLLASKYTPEIYRAVYTYLDQKDKMDDKYNITSLVNLLCALKFEKSIERYSPDVIIFTHIFAGRIVNELKSRATIRIPAIGVLTDYTFHPFWEDVPQVEYVVTANELLTHQAERKQIARARVLPLGIPIHPKFANMLSKEEARARLGLKEDRTTVLVMAGSMGYGNMSTIVDQIRSIDRSFQIIAVCGNNKRQYKKLSEYKEEKGLTGLMVLGFADNVEVLMDAADCIVTKPGGLTVSEALAKKLPMILVNPIPGQEERNVEFLLNNGMAMMVTRTFPLDEAVYEMFTNPTRIRIMEENICVISKPNATRDLCDFVMKLAQNEEA